jgi:acyl carrier protein
MQHVPADRTTVGESVTRIWCEILEIDDTDADEDFFTLGGNSLLAVKLVERLEKEFRIAFPLDALFIDGSLQAVIDACLGQLFPPAGEHAAEPAATTP